MMSIQQYEELKTTKADIVSFEDVYIYLKKSLENAKIKGFIK